MRPACEHRKAERRAVTNDRVVEKDASINMRLEYDVQVEHLWCRDCRTSFSRELWHTKKPAPGQVLPREEPRSEPKWDESKPKASAGTDW